MHPWRKLCFEEAKERNQYSGHMQPMNAAPSHVLYVKFVSWTAAGNKTERKRFLKCTREKLFECFFWCGGSNCASMLTAKRNKYVTSCKSDHASLQSKSCEVETKSFPAWPEIAKAQAIFGKPRGG